MRPSPSGSARAALLLLVAATACGEQTPPPAPTPAVAPPPRAAGADQPYAGEARPSRGDMRSDFIIDGAARQGDLLIGRAPSGTERLTLDGRAIPLAGDGHFLVAFDRDHEGEARLVAELGDGGTVEERIAVAARGWDLQHIDAPLRPSGSSAEFRRIRAAELARITAARAKDAQSDGWRQDFAWPVRGRISGVFGSQRVYRGEPGSYHSGLDIAPGAGAVVVAPADGVVVLASPPPFSLEGNLVMIDHGMGLNSAFLHLATVAVREGERVRRGARIGTVGATGRATGPHLHWSMKWRDARIDPLPLVEGEGQ